MTEHQAREHDMILYELDNLDYSPTALAETESALLSVDLRLAELQKLVTELQRKAKSEFKDISKLQHSSGKRLLVRLQHGGKKEAVGQLLQEEEQQYMKDMEAEHAAESNMTSLQTQKAKLEANIAHLRHQTGKFTDLRQRLDNLYSSVFDDRTSDYPWEVQAKREVKRAESSRFTAESHLDKETHALALLVEAGTCFQKCLDDLRMAKGWDLDDMYSGTNGVGGGAYPLLKETHSLRDAKDVASRGQTLVDQARAIQPQILAVGRIDASELDFLSKIVFDTRVSDAMIAQHIRDSATKISTAAAGVRSEILQAQHRVHLAEGWLRTATDKLEDQRRNLEDVRRTILRSISQGAHDVPAPRPARKQLGDDNEAPPPYFAYPAAEGATTEKTGHSRLYPPESASALAATSSSGTREQTESRNPFRHGPSTQLHRREEL